MQQSTDTPNFCLAYVDPVWYFSPIMPRSLTNKRHTNECSESRKVIKCPVNLVIMDRNLARLPCACGKPVSFLRWRLENELGEEDINGDIFRGLRPFHKTERSPRKSRAGYDGRMPQERLEELATLALTRQTLSHNGMATIPARDLIALVTEVMERRALNTAKPTP